MKILLIALLLFSHLGHSEKPDSNKVLENTFEQDFVDYIQQQKSKLNIPLDLGHQILNQNLGHGNNKGWPRYLVIKFEHHFHIDKQVAYYLMTCIQRMTAFKCKKQEIKRIKYNNRWIRNLIKKDMTSDALIDVINFAELSKPDDWLLPVLNINYKNGLFYVCFGMTQDQSTDPNQYRFPRYCLPIKRTQKNDQYEYQAEYGLIEYSELIVD